MDNNSVFRAKPIFLFLIVLFICGCATSEVKKQALIIPEPTLSPALASEIKKPKICLSEKYPLTYDVVSFRKLNYIDLDNDGDKDLIVTYISFFGMLGVKAVRTDGDKAQTIFRRLYTPDTNIIVKEDIPAIIVKENFYIFWKKTKNVFVWNGNIFTEDKV